MDEAETVQQQPAGLEPLDQEAVLNWDAAPLDELVEIPLSRGDVNALLFAMRRMQDALAHLITGVEALAASDVPEALAKARSAGAATTTSMDDLTRFMNGIMAKARRLGDG